MDPSHVEDATELLHVRHGREIALFSGSQVDSCYGWRLVQFFNQPIFTDSGEFRVQFRAYLRGGVALQGYAGEEAYFAKVKVNKARDVADYATSEVANFWLLHNREFVAA